MVTARGAARAAREAGVGAATGGGHEREVAAVPRRVAATAVADPQHQVGQLRAVPLQAQRPAGIEEVGLRGTRGVGEQQQVLAIGRLRVAAEVGLAATSQRHGGQAVEGRTRRHPGKPDGAGARPAAIAQELQGVPTFRKVLPFTAFMEGWALYAEWLGTELGVPLPAVE